MPDVKDKRSSFAIRVLNRIFGQIEILGRDASGNQVPLTLATDGTQELIVHGKDSSGNVDPLRTNDSQQLQVEVVGLAASSTPISVDPVPLTEAAADVYDPAGAAADIFDIQFLVSNVTATAYYATVGVDVDDGGSVSDGELIFQEVIPGNGTSGWNKCRINGEDVIIALAEATESLVIHFIVDQVASA